MNACRPPCKANKDGPDCPDRCIGCHSSCEKYKAFRAACDERKKKAAARAMCVDYSCRQIYLDRHKLRHVYNAMRILAQR